MDYKTVTSDILYKLDTTYSNLKRSEAIQKLFTRSINVGEAVVNILGNTGIAGFRFHINNSEQVKMESEITDHYVDTNSTIQDHIAIKPVTITVNGLQGEYFYSVNQIQDMLAKVTPTMSLVKQFLPKLSEAAKQIRRKKIIKENHYNAETNSLEASIRLEEYNFNAIDLFKTFQDIYKLKSAQTRAFLFFEAMHRSRAVFSVSTHWKRYDNMVIQSLTPIRDNNADITEFTITFKQLTFTESKTESVEQYAGRTAQAMSKVVNKGIDKGEYVPTIP